MDAPAILLLVQWGCIIFIVGVFLWFLFGHVGVPEPWLFGIRMALVIALMISVLLMATGHSVRAASSYIAPNPNSVLNPSIVR